MTGRAPRTPGEELLLARISAAAGREHLGRRRATYTGAARTVHANTVRVRAVRCLLTLVRYAGPSAVSGYDIARLDLYEHGMTVAAKGRIHVIRYDTTQVRTSPPRPYGPARGGTAHTLTDVGGRRVVLRGGPERGDAAEWWAEIQRGVVRARLPRALAALDQGERLTFGDVWLTREEVGYGEVRATWSRVRRVRARDGAVELDIDGTWHGLGSKAAGIPDHFVLRALVERLGPDGGR
ncbi:DUF6585 family protein [Streptomyces albireticuli]|uniref:Uncharacterized protein n=1 Tax=Streptomyces albireticuli TaxID=1940 RepID=A0A2A2DDD8_9ACTN|nr:DUF6585 family protein [Streptomyces albireticuli]MCD9144918.1 hypothetical protein [Streptomyces albireticuli]MCD9164344.1 hypothetical protein [Streptomyces albireticuli]MCD9194055.1 hypothetical protein [Streptomyces albireticuli]PAU49312.1 hypothetical protein CK936_08555 [Streptomyces albireticuli]